MVLNKHEENGAIENLYDSSNILASKYDIRGKKLAIIFNSGRQYLYHDVSRNDYDVFEGAESQGKILHSTIKKYKVEKVVDIVDTTLIIEQIQTLKNS
jgi:hypothetical protein|tara:strand:+ start:81 stop:374 length:294 start_codon:yes stop_codon:yes gene_type:complete